MQDSVNLQIPTTLFTPPAASTEQPSGLAGSNLIIFGAALILISGYFLLIRRNRRKLSAGELAFRTLVKDLGYSKGQVRKIRSYAMSHGHPSPVGIVLSQELTARAMRSSRL